MKKLFVFLVGGSAGGTATLSLRMGRWLIRHEWDVVYICPKYTDENNIALMKEIGIKTHKWQIKEMVKNFMKEYDHFSEFYFVSYVVDLFLISDSIKKLLNKKTNCYLYVVLDRTLVKGQYINEGNKLKKYILYFANTVNLNYVTKLYKNNNIIFMDESCVSMTEKYYRIQFEDIESKIFRLPMQINDGYSIKEINLNKFIIITAARMAFPFKGYIIGLIKDFAELKKAYSHIELVIIGNGESLYEVEKVIASLDTSISQDIKLPGNVRYDELIKYFSKAHVFVGMGTSILDAVNSGVLSIVVSSFTYQNRAIGMFHENPLTLGEPDNYIDTMSCKKIIETIINIGPENYANLVKMDYNALLENYDINNFMKRLIDLKNINKHPVGSWRDLITIRLINKLSILYNRKKLKK